VGSPPGGGEARHGEVFDVHFESPGHLPARSDWQLISAISASVDRDVRQSA